MLWKNHAQGPWNYWLHKYLAAGHSVNIRDFHGKTPLHHALVTKYEREDKVRALVEAGADITMRDFAEQTPVDLAKREDEGLFIFPLMLIYAAINYSVFRGKVRPTAEHY